MFVAGSKETGRQRVHTILTPMQDYRLRVPEDIDQLWHYVRLAGNKVDVQDLSGLVERCSDFVIDIIRDRLRTLMRLQMLLKFAKANSPLPSLPSHPLTSPSTTTVLAHFPSRPNSTKVSGQLLSLGEVTVPELLG